MLKLWIFALVSGLAAGNSCGDLTARLWFRWVTSRHLRSLSPERIRIHPVSAREVEIGTPAGHWIGTVVSSPVRFPRRSEGRASLIQAVRNPEGSTYLLIGNGPPSIFISGKGALRDLTKRYPQIFEPKGIYADRNFTLLPLPTEDRHFNNLKGSAQIGQRYTATKGRYTAEAFNKALAKGRILIAMKGHLADHDIAAEHFPGGLLVPKELFYVFQNQAIKNPSDPTLSKRWDEATQLLAEALTKSKKSESHDLIRRGFQLLVEPQVEESRLEVWVDNLLRLMESPG